MGSKEKVYIAIDLKSFYASVECVDRKLDPLTTNLVVADVSRTEKTICLAVSPSLKAYGIPGRPRLFEVVQKTKALGLDYITAPPRMARYIEVSSQVYGVYLKYISPQDIHVYSIDEVFIDITGYGQIYGLTPAELARKIVADVLTTTGITATVGIGTNLYLCKIAMDIMAKHTTPDGQGVRMAELDEMSYRRRLWGHQPITDFWRVGRGYAQKLARQGLYTMGDIARCSLGKVGKDYYNEELLYTLFGINAELLIDHAWGWEPCTIADIKGYKPATKSISSGQVLHCPYTCEKARLAVREMADLLSLDLISKGLVTNQLTLTIGYDKDNLSNPRIKQNYQGPVVVDGYGRLIPKHTHGTFNLNEHTASGHTIVDGVMILYGRIANPQLLVRRITISANNVLHKTDNVRQVKEIDLFAEMDTQSTHNVQEKSVHKVHKKDGQSEYELQKAVVELQQKYGKNSVLKGMNLEEGAMTRERNKQIGGHKA